MWVYNDTAFPTDFGATVAYLVFLVVLNKSPYVGCDALAATAERVSVSTTNPAIQLPIVKIKVSFLMLWLHFSSQRNDILVFYNGFGKSQAVNYCKEKATKNPDKFSVYYIEQYFFSVKSVLKLNI